MNSDRHCNKIEITYYLKKLWCKVLYLLTDISAIKLVQIWTVTFWCVLHANDSDGNDCNVCLFLTKQLLSSEGRTFAVS